MRKAISIFLFTALSGCASVPGLYVDIGAGYKLPSTSLVLWPECHEVVPIGSENKPVNRRRSASCGGDNPTAHIRFGFEFKDGSYCEFLDHWSHYFDGGASRETHKDEVLCAKRFGGRNRNAKN